MSRWEPTWTVIRFAICVNFDDVDIATLIFTEMHLHVARCPTKIRSLQDVGTEHADVELVVQVFQPFCINPNLLSRLVKFEFSILRCFELLPGIVSPSEAIRTSATIYPKRSMYW